MNSPHQSEVQENEVEEREGQQRDSQERDRHEHESQEHQEWSERQTVHSPVLPAQKARQGGTGHHVRYALGIGIAAIIIVFLGIYLAYFG